MAGLLAAWMFAVYPAAKTRPTDTPPRVSEVAVTLAGREYEPFLVGVYNPTEQPVHVSGLRIDRPESSRLKYEVFLVQYVTVPKTTHWYRSSRHAGKWPDPLVPLSDAFVGESTAAGIKSEYIRHGVALEIPPRENRLILVDLFLPSDAVGAAETWTVSFEADVSMPKGVTVSIGACSFSLPIERSLATSFGFAETIVFEKHRRDSPVAFSEDDLLRSYAPLVSAPSGAPRCLRG